MSYPGPGAENPIRPSQPEEVVEWLEAGKITPAEAFSFLYEIELGGGPAGIAAPPERRLPGPAVDPGAESDRAQIKRVEEVMRELDMLVGLRRVRGVVKEITAFAQIQQRRAREGLAAEPTVLHMVFKGNPGTGKTTVARIIGRILKETGVLSKGHLVEVERADLVGEYIGHTAQKTREQIKRALGGVLFIDEAYSLARGGEKDFGKEAIDTLVKAMEDHKDDLLLIIAGYLREMDWFMVSNPGLKSRFPIQIEFPDYTASELLKIAEMMLGRRQYRLAPDAWEALALRLATANGPYEDNFGNARLVRNLIERAIRRQAVRLMGKTRLTRDDLMLIQKPDLAEEVDA